MTRIEAEKELAELEPRESEAWQVMAKIESDLNEYTINIEKARLKTKEAFDKQEREARDRWLPLFRRKQQLKAFIEIAT